MKEIIFTKKDAFKAVARLSVLMESLADGKEYVLTLNEKPKKRSLDANAYFWKFCGELSAKLGIPPVEIYRDLIKNIGDNYEVVCVKAEAAEKLRNGWEHNGKGWVTEEMQSKIHGCVNIILYYGSSTYDTKQMSHLIDLLITECKEQGIDTRTLEELSLVGEA